MKLNRPISLLSLLLAALLVGCSKPPEAPPTTTKVMALRDQSEIQRTLSSLTNGMIDYITPGKTRYTKDHVEKCHQILIAHLNSLDQTQTRTQAMDLVKTTVLQLNTLNREAGHELIETDQREEICAILIKAGALKGFNGEHEDVTEEWREW